MKYTLYILGLCFTWFSHAQHITKKTYSAEDITSVNIIGENIFKISVETQPINEIRIHSRIEGENSESIVLVDRSSDENFNIEAKFQPIIKNPNDKLSAHKVISIEVELVIPENLNLLVYLHDADINIVGQYNKTLVSSNNGNIFLDDFLGDLKIFTQNGNIFLSTNNVKVSTTSKNGIVKKEKLDSGKNKIDIKTINGDITIIKSQ